MTGEDDCGSYGMRDGRLLFIADVQRGLACGCICVRCHKRLIARKGRKRRHHFAHHEATNCLGAAETALHILAKELLSQAATITLPAYEFSKERKTKAGVLVQHQATIAKGGEVRIESVRVEMREGDFVPDLVVLEAGSKSLIVEIAVTHRVGRDKLRKLRNRNLPAIEIRLGRADSFLTREEISQKILTDLRAKNWLYHPKQRDAEWIFAKKYRSAVVSARSRVRARMEAIANGAGPRAGKWIPADKRPDWYVYDQLGEKCRQRNGRYPTLEECRDLWPDLYLSHKK